MTFATFNSAAASAPALLYTTASSGTELAFMRRAQSQPRRQNSLKLRAQGHTTQLVYIDGVSTRCRFGCTTHQVKRNLMRSQRSAPEVAPGEGGPHSCNCSYRLSRAFPSAIQFAWIASMGCGTSCQFPPPHQFTSKVSCQGADQ